MPVDVARRLVFIHVPKTGGTSIEALLGLRRRDCFFSRTPLPYLTPNNKVPQHFTYLELRHILGRSFMSGAFKFAFVRNPWDRFASEYEWRRRGWAARHPLDKEERYYAASDLRDLDSFCAVLRLPEEQRTDARRGFDGHLETAHSYVCDASGDVAVDYLGRFETFESDVRKVMAHLGSPECDVPRLQAGTPREHYRAYYSSQARAAVEEFYWRDIETFHYSF